MENKKLTGIPKVPKKVSPQTPKAPKKLSPGFPTIEPPKHK